MKICGIDAGAKGALAFITDGILGGVYAMPLSKQKLSDTKVSKDVNYLGVEEIIRKENPDYVILEVQSPQGVKTSGLGGFGIGRNYKALLIGIERGINSLEDETNLLFVTPSEWKRFLALMKKKDDERDKKLITAEFITKEFPDFDRYTKRGRLLDGECDAIAIILYAIRSGLI